jgi:hypothetical protein
LENQQATAKAGAAINAAVAASKHTCHSETSDRRGELTFWLAATLDTPQTFKPGMQPSSKSGNPRISDRERSKAALHRILKPKRLTQSVRLIRSTNLHACKQRQLGSHWCVLENSHLIENGQDTQMIAQIADF